MLNRRQTLMAATGLLAAGAARAQAPTSQAPATPAITAPAAMPPQGKRAWAEQVPTLRIGLLGGENDSDRLGRYDAYRNLLEQTFGIPVRLYPAADYAGVIQAFGAKQIELASMGSSGYAAAWMDTNGNVEPLVVAVENDGSISYRSVLVVRGDSGITDLVGMKGKSLAWADPNSTSGYLIPRSELKKAGIDTADGKYFSRTGFAGGHEQGVVAVLQKQYDGAVTWASGIGDPAEGYSRGNLHEMVQKGMLKMNDIKVLWTSSPILNGPITARLDTPDAFRADLATFHLALPAAHPQIYAQVERGGGKGYQRVKHADFQVFIDLRKDEAAQRRQRS
jgi:phosphonate transport system substrate-binding protein